MKPHIHGVEQNMGVFDSITLMQSPRPDFTPDKALGGSGSLGYRTIASPEGLTGGSGNQGTTIHGDHWETYDGNLNTRVKGNWTIWVEKDVDVKIKQNVTNLEVGEDVKYLHIKGNSTTQIDKAETHTTIGPTTELRVGEHNQCHQSQEANQDIVDLSAHWLKADAFGVRVEANGLLGTSTLGHADFYGGKLEMGLGKKELNLNHDEVKALKGEVQALKIKVGTEADIEGMDARIVALENRVGALSPKFFGLRIGCFSIGFNQWT
jgi:hypothetical protein